MQLDVGRGAARVLAIALRRPLRDRAVRLLLLLAFASALSGLLAPTAHAQEGSGEVLILHGDDDSDSDQERRRGLRLLATQGAGRYEASALTPWTDLVGQGVAGPAPRTGCESGAPLRAKASLSAELDNAVLAVQYGRNEVATSTLSAITDSLPCAGEPLDDVFLARLWFLLGAVHHLEGRKPESRSAFERAALVDFAVAFDDLFPATVHDALLTAKNGVLERGVARVAVLGDAEVWVDGRLVPTENGAGWIQARLGPRLVQVMSGDRTHSFVVDLAAVPARDGVASLVVLSREGLDGALRILERDDAPTTPIARAALLGVMAERAEPYAVLVATRRDRSREERPLTALDVVTAQTGPHRPRTSQADVFGRRARISVAPMYRVLSRPKETALNYGGIEAVGWVPVHWLVRAGFGARWAFTPRPAPEGKTACCSTFEVSPRVRLERGNGLFRPFGELGFLLFWPAGTTEGMPPGALDVAAGFDIGGGLMVTPGEARRVGIALAGFGGAVAGLGPMAELRVSVELRF